MTAAVTWTVLWFVFMIIGMVVGQVGGTMGTFLALTEDRRWLVFTLPALVIGFGFAVFALIQLIIQGISLVQLLL